MNKEFKEEFKNLNSNEIKELINKCAGQEILESANNLKISHFIKYIENESYGFWIVEWARKKVQHFNMAFGVDIFEFSIKITPFKVEFENSHLTLNPFSRTNNKKLLEDYLPIFINKNCPHYKHAIIEETKKFIQYLDMDKDKNNLDIEKELSI